MRGTRPPTYDDLPDLCTPDDACRFLQVNVNTVYELVKSGALTHVKFGRLIRIPKSALLPKPDDTATAPGREWTVKRRAL